MKLRIIPHSQNLRMKIQFSPSHSACFWEKHVVKIEFSYEDSESVEGFQASRMVTKLLFFPKSICGVNIGFLRDKWLWLRFSMHFFRNYSEMNISWHIFKTNGVVRFRGKKLNCKTDTNLIRTSFPKIATNFNLFYLTEFLFLAWNRVCKFSVYYFVV